MTLPFSAGELNRTLAVWRPSLVDDGAGGQTVTMVEVGTVRGRVSRPTAAEQVAAAQAGAAITAAVYLLPDSDVSRGDELRGDEQAFRVKATYQPSEPAYLRADVELLQREPEQVGS